MWCDLGFVPNSRGNKAAANLRPRSQEVFGHELMFAKVRTIAIYIIYKSIISERGNAFF